jgi:uncharacterized coiled-coil DUF342 family protein
MKLQDKIKQMSESTGRTVVDQSSEVKQLKDTLRERNVTIRELQRQLKDCQERGRSTEREKDKTIVTVNANTDEITELRLAIDSLRSENSELKSALKAFGVADKKQSLRSDRDVKVSVKAERENK